MRDKTLKIRVSPEELCAIGKRQPESLPLAAWLRSLAIGEPLQPKRRRRAPFPVVEPELLRQLAGLGNNLNQVARAINQANRAGGLVNVVAVLSTLISMDRELVEIRVAHTFSSPKREGKK